MSDTTTESLDESLPYQDFPTEVARRETSTDPLWTESRARARLTAARSSLGNATAWTSGKAAPVIDRAQAYRGPLLAAVAAVVAAVLAAWRRRRASDPVIDESLVDLGDWHVTGEPNRTN